MNIQSISVSRINPAPYNPRKELRPGDMEYKKLARSLETFGCVEPLVWNRRTCHLVGGHQRFRVLQSRGEQEVQVSVVDLPLEQEKALNLALNKITGEWDEPKLAELLKDLVDTPDLDLDLTGFELDEANDLIADLIEGVEGARQEEFDINAALEAAGPPVTQPDDLIILGRDPDLQHRLLCGDCTDSVQVRKLMADQRATLFATDPPYLVDYDGTNRPTPAKNVRRFRKNQRPKRQVDSKVTWDASDGNPDLYKKFCKAALDEAIQPNAAWYCWHASRRQGLLESAWNDVGAFVHCQIIRVKNKGVPSRSWYMWQHEPCFMGWVKGHPPPRSTKRGTTTVWQVDTLPNGPKRPDHPTPKPVEVFEIPIRQHTRRGDVCYEPFAGSGTQFIAAERLKRRCFGLEISPVYCDLIVRRYIAFYGEKSVNPEIAQRYRLTKKEVAV